MSSQLMLAFLLFSISIAITPGAGNIALLGTHPTRRSHEQQ